MILLQHTAATHCNTLQHTATHCNTLQHTATHCNTLQHTASHCTTLLHTVPQCTTLHHIETHRVLTDSITESCIEQFPCRNPAFQKFLHRAVSALCRLPAILFRCRVRESYGGILHRAAILHRADSCIPLSMQESCIELQSCIELIGAFLFLCRNPA